MPDQGFPSLPSSNPSTMGASALATGGGSLAGITSGGNSAPHPMAQASTAKSAAPSLPVGQVPKTVTKTKGYTFTMGKLSLLAIALSLMLLGVFVFGSGFLVGMWFFSSPGGGSVPAAAGGYGTIGYGAAASSAPTSNPTGGGFGADIANEASAIGFGGIASQQAGISAQQAVSNISIPGIPSALNPLVSQTQIAVGQQVSGVAAQQTGQAVKQGIQTMQAPQAQAPQAQAPQAQGPSLPPPGMQAPQGPAPQGQAPLAPGAASSPSSSAGSSSPLYTVRLGEFVAKENAVDLMSEIQYYNFPANIVEQQSPSGHTLYVVESGQYPSQDMARQAAENFVNVNLPRALIVPVTSQNLTSPNKS